MDQQTITSSFSPSFLALILVLSVLLIISSYKKSKLPHRKLPPGPWRLPIIGNLHQIISSHPHRHLANMAKKYGPLMHLQLGQVPHLIVSSPEAAMEVMKNHDLEFSGRPSSFATSVLTYNYKDIAFGAYGDYWRWLRKICVIDLLGTKRVQSFRYIRDEEVSSMVESIRVASSSSSSSQGSSTTTTVDVKKVILALVSSVTARASFGKSSKERNDVYVPLVKRTNEAFAGFGVADLFPSIGFLPAITGVKSNVLKLHREVDEVLESIIDERRAGKAESMAGNGEPKNLLDFLLDLQEHGGDRLEFPLTMEHVKAIISQMFTGGIETSSTVVEWAMSELVANPTAMRKVQTELRQAFKDEDKIDETRLHTLKYFQAVIKETLRLHPPFTLLLRKVRENVTVYGYEIPAGTGVAVNAWAVGRDPKYWTKPEIFYPERFFDNAIDYKGTHFQYIPFGAGRRMCPGLQFGVAMVEVALANLLYHFDWEVPDGKKPESLDMSEASGLATAKKVPLHLKPMPWKQL